MASVDNLPGDQRAVLQLVIGRGRSYDQIAGMLSMNPASVRERAHAAIDALGPQTDVSPESRALIADYLLRQLSGPEEALRAIDLLEGSAAERAWARVVASELSPLGGGALPEIPAEGGGRGGSPPPVVSAPPPPPLDSPAPEPEPVEPSAAPAAGPRLAPSDPTAGGQDHSGSGAGSGSGRRAAGGGPGGLGGGGGRRSSRLGGAILIAAVVIAAIVVAVVLLSSGNGSPNHQTAADRSSTTTASTPAASASATASSSATTTTSGNTSASAKVVAQINLTPPAKASKAAGIAEVLDEGSSQGIAIVADNVPPNKTAPHPNAYAVWLYNSPSDAHILGFVNPGVGSNGRLSTAGALPSNASRYKQLVVTVETQAKPAKPGTIILRGPLTGLS